jgi:Domain of unknown function (DUF4384)
MNRWMAVEMKNRLFLLVFALSAASCAPSEARPAASASGTAQCQGQPREPLNCDSEVQYQATDVKGGFSVLGVGNASGGVEQKALRQMDDQTALYVAEARRLCDEYNKCVIDRDAYATRSENMRRRMAKVPELLDQVRSASGDDERRVALAKAYREIVPGEARTDLQLDFSVLAQRPGEASMQAIQQDAALPTGSHAALLVHVSRPAYVYLFEKSGHGALHMLFPDPRIALNNPIAGNSLRIPQGNASFKLDDQDVGIESIYIVASLRPVARLEAAAATTGASTPAAAQTALGTVASIDPRCHTRGFSLDEDAPAPGGCSRSRGLSLDDGAGPSAGQASQSTVTEAGDDTIAMVFRFEHIEK